MIRIANTSMSARLTAPLLLMLSLLAGCAQQPPVPEDRFYRLQTPQDGSVTHPLKGSVAVKRLQSDALHNDRAILYSEASQPLQLKRYHYHFWIDTPPRLISEHLISWLRHSRAADVVLTDRPGVRPDYTLSGKIRRFEQITDKGQSSVEVSLELQLENNGNHIPLLVRDYSARVAARSRNIEDVIAAFSEALTRIYADFMKDVSSLPQGQQ
jgi:ABC-type uncharacterized transport system auxiliary subunit